MNCALKNFRNHELREIIISLIILVIMKLERQHINVAYF